VPGFLKSLKVGEEMTPAVLACLLLPEIFQFCTVPSLHESRHDGGTTTERTLSQSKRTSSLRRDNKEKSVFVFESSIEEKVETSYLGTAAQPVAS
jgi:hypothetical protein